jgi:hypothetical protein
VRSCHESALLSYRLAALQRDLQEATGKLREEHLRCTSLEMQLEDSQNACLEASRRADDASSFGAEVKSQLAEQSLKVSRLSQDLQSAMQALQRNQELGDLRAQGEQLDAQSLERVEVLKRQVLLI